MTFANPLLLLTLLVVPSAGAVYVLARRRRMRYAIRFTNLDVLSQVAGRHAWRRYVPATLSTIALALLCVAVARPQALTRTTTKESTVILVVDTSLSMHATDVKPSRLGAARAAVRAFLQRVPGRVQIGLVVFSGDAEVGAPPTTDRSLVRESLDSVGDTTSFGGTAIGDALVLAVELGQTVGTTSPSRAAPRPDARRGLVSILFLSDGRQNAGTVQPLEASRRARAAGMRVYTIALGTDHGRLPSDLDAIGAGTSAAGISSRLLDPDPKTLKAISKITGGEFFRARSAGALKATYAELGARLAGRPAKTEVTYAFLGTAAALLVAATALSALWSPRFP